MSSVVGIVGNLTADPELGQGKTGTKYARMRVAVTPYGTEETTFYSVVAFGTLAENAAGVLQKGDRVNIVSNNDGVVEEEWTGRDGQVRTSLKIIAEGVGQDLRFAL